MAIQEYSANSTNHGYADFHDPANPNSLSLNPPIIKNQSQFLVDNWYVAGIGGKRNIFGMTIFADWTGNQPADQDLDPSLNNSQFDKFYLHMKEDQFSFMYAQGNGLPSSRIYGSTRYGFLTSGNELRNFVVGRTSAYVDLYYDKLTQPLDVNLPPRGEGHWYDISDIVKEVGAHPHYNDASTSYFRRRWTFVVMQDNRDTDSLQSYPLKAYSPGSSLEGMKILHDIPLNISLEIDGIEASAQCHNAIGHGGLASSENLYDGEQLWYLPSEWDKVKRPSYIEGLEYIQSYQSPIPSNAGYEVYPIQDHRDVRWGLDNTNLFENSLVRSYQAPESGSTTYYSVIDHDAEGLPTFRPDHKGSGSAEGTIVGYVARTRTLFSEAYFVNTTNAAGYAARQWLTRGEDYDRRDYGDSPGNDTHDNSISWWEKRDLHTDSFGNSYLPFGTVCGHKFTSYGGVQLGCIVRTGTVQDPFTGNHCFALEFRANLGHNLGMTGTQYERAWFFMVNPYDTRYNFGDWNHISIVKHITGTSDGYDGISLFINGVDVQAYEPYDLADWTQANAVGNYAWRGSFGPAMPEPVTEEAKRTCWWGNDNMPNPFGNFGRIGLDDMWISENRYNEFGIGCGGPYDSVLNEWVYQTFDGQIDDLRIYKRALNSAEVRKLSSERRVYGAVLSVGNDSSESQSEVQRIFEITISNVTPSSAESISQVSSPALDLGGSLALTGSESQAEASGADVPVPVTSSSVESASSIESVSLGVSFAASVQSVQSSSVSQEAKVDISGAANSDNVKVSAECSTVSITADRVIEGIGGETYWVSASRDNDNEDTASTDIFVDGKANLTVTPGQWLGDTNDGGDHAFDAGTRITIPGGLL